jgi:hypothetical protein
MGNNGIIVNIATGSTVSRRGTIEEACDQIPSTPPVEPGKTRTAPKVTGDQSRHLPSVARRKRAKEILT